MPLASESSQPVQAAAKAKNKPRQPKAKAEPKEAPKRAAKKTAKAQQPEPEAVEVAPPASAEEAPVAEAAAAPVAALVPALLDAEVVETQKEAVEQPPATPVHQTRAPTSPALSDRTMTPFYRTKSESLGFLHHWLEKPKIPREVIVDDDEGEDRQAEQPPPEAVAHQTCMRPTCFSFSCFVSDSAAPACSSASWTVLTSKCVQAFYFLMRANDETPT